MKLRALKPSSLLAITDVARLEELNREIKFLETVRGLSNFQDGAFGSMHTESKLRSGCDDDATLVKSLKRKASSENDFVLDQLRLSADNFVNYWSHCLGSIQCSGSPDLSN